MKFSKIFLTALLFCLSFSSSIASEEGAYVASQMASIHMCIPGSYFDGSLVIKRNSSYCMMKQTQVKGHPNAVKICKYPLTFYKNMMDDNFKLSPSQFDSKYRNAEANYCKLIRK